MTTTRELQASREFGALVASLRGLEARRAAIKASRPAGEPISLTFLPAASEIMSRAASEAKLDPVIREHRASIRGIGEQLHAAGGMGAMLRMSDAVEARLGVRAAVRLDKLWNGVGQQWWA